MVSLPVNNAGHLLGIHFASHGGGLWRKVVGCHLVPFSPSLILSQKFGSSWVGFGRWMSDLDGFNGFAAIFGSHVAQLEQFVTFYSGMWQLLFMKLLTVSINLFFLLTVLLGVASFKSLCMHLPDSPVVYCSFVSLHWEVLRDFCRNFHLQWKLPSPKTSIWDFNI